MKKRILYIGNKLSKKGNTITSIESLGNFLSNEGYTIKTASNKQNKLLRLLDMIWVTLKNKSTVDVVLIDTYSTQNFYYAVLIGFLCKKLNLEYIPILRGGSLPLRLKKSPQLSQKLFKNAKTNIAPSAYLLDAFKKEGFTNLTYIPNTIEIKNYPYLERNRIQAKLLWVRSFSEIYNPKLAITIVEELLKKSVDVTLCMIGPEKDGSLKECQDIAQQKKLTIKFTGLLSKKEWIDLSKDYDIFINTTNFDNTPVSVIEAMALGLPVISANVGGIPYLIDNQETGVIVPPNDKQAFVNAITELISNPDKTKKLSNNARLKVESFDWEVVKEKWDKVFK